MKLKATLVLGLLLAASALAGRSEDASLTVGKNLAADAADAQTAGVIPKRSIQAGVADCVWDGASCSLRRDFVNGLPGVLGSPTTESAKILADAALRAAVCSNFTGKPECLEAVSYTCDWDTVLNRCTLADVLNATMLRGLAYCPGSRLDAAMGCLALRPSECTSTSTSTSSPSLNCTLIDSISLPAWMTGGGGSSSGSGSSGLGAAVSGDRQLSTMMGTVLGSLVKYGMAGMADPISQWISGMLQGASGAVSSVKVCAASWMTDSATLSSLGGNLGSALQANLDPLSSLLSLSDLAGSCNGTINRNGNGNSTTTQLPLLAAAAACRDAGSSSSSSSPSSAGGGGGGAAAACAATSGCRWLSVSGGGGVCTLGPDALPRLVLDPSDRWVAVLNNATAICRSFTDAGSCGAAINVAAGLESAAAAAAGGRGGGGGDGGAAGAAAVSWGLLAAAAAAAMALGDAARRGV